MPRARQRDRLEHHDVVTVPEPSDRPAAPYDWTLLTRAIAPNTFATFVVEVRCSSEAIAGEDPRVEVWLNGACIGTDLTPGAALAFVLELRSPGAR
jgi:hypothetical protein